MIRGYVGLVIGWIIVIVKCFDSIVSIISVDSCGCCKGDYENNEFGFYNCFLD